jgi:hypothetical protein
VPSSSFGGLDDSGGAAGFLGLVPCPVFLVTVILANSVSQETGPILDHIRA